MIVVVIGAVLVLAACSSSNPRAGDSSKESSTREVPSNGPTRPSTAAIATPDPSPGTVGSAPVIVSFKVTHQPTCPVAATASSPSGTPGQPVTLAWNVTGAAQITLAIDDPAHTGSGATYNARSSVTLAFPCDPTNLANNSHIYAITAGTVSKTITVSAKT